MRGDPNNNLRLSDVGTQLTRIPSETIAAVPGTSSGIYTFDSKKRAAIIHNNSGDTIKVRVNATAADECTDTVYDLSIEDGKEFLFDLGSGFKIGSFGIFFASGASDANITRDIRGWE